MKQAPSGSEYGPPGPSHCMRRACSGACGTVAGPVSRDRPNSPAQEPGLAWPGRRRRPSSCCSSRFGPHIHLPWCCFHPPLLQPPFHTREEENIEQHHCEFWWLPVGGCGTLIPHNQQVIFFRASVQDRLCPSQGWSRASERCGTRTVRLGDCGVVVSRRPGTAGWVMI
jgi:hypothetical protein